MKILLIMLMLSEINAMQISPQQTQIVTVNQNQNDDNCLECESKCTTHKYKILFALSLLGFGAGLAGLIKSFIQN